MLDISSQGAFEEMEKILAALSQLGLTAKLHEHHEYTSHDEHVRYFKYIQPLFQALCLIFPRNYHGYRFSEEKPFSPSGKTGVSPFSHNVPSHMLADQHT